MTGNGLKRRNTAETLVDATPAAALAGWFAVLDNVGAAPKTAVEAVSLVEVQGRVVAVDVRAVQPVPPFPVAAMDGIALRAADVRGIPGLLRDGSFVPIDTGQAVGDGWDSVVPIEETSPAHPGIIIRTAVTAGQHIRPVGEDISADAVVFVAGRRLGPYEIGLAASCGHRSVLVHVRPRVAILPTGDELRPAGQPLGPGETAESNGLMLAALTRNAGGDPVLLPTERDDPDDLSKAIRAATEECDVLLILSGSSQGVRDHTAKVLDRIGRIAVKGVALRPGHPVILGHVGSTPVVGLPGYPVSAAQAFGRFVAPLLQRATNATTVFDLPVPVELATPIHARLDTEIMVPVRLERREGRLPLAYPQSRKGAALRAFASADAVIHVLVADSLEAGTILYAERRPGE